MTRTETIQITLNKNGDGYNLSSDKGLSAWGQIAKRMDGTMGVTQDGTWSLGYDWREAGYTRAQIDEAIWQTLTTGQPTTITLTREIATAPMPQSSRRPCPRCHTYCDGDCRS